MGRNFLAAGEIVVGAAAAGIEPGHETNRSRYRPKWQLERVER